jgi:hypothetical protein
MKNLFILLSLVCTFTFVLSINVSAQTSGGPDAFGYVWITSDVDEGPVFSWIDISTTGTEVTDLMDDNSVGFFPIGFDFRYYENTYNQFKIGSNGWISFNDVSNISLCFPPVPTAGANGDNILFVFAADLNHVTAAEANPARVYYQNFGTEFTVISFIDVPYWINNSAGFDGSNSFQIIIDSYDNSITYQYLSLEPTVLNALEACNMNTSVGFENADGIDGLQIYSNLDIPANGTAIKIVCPDCFTSIPNNTDANISVYPNPVSNKLFINAENLVSAKVFDEQGKLISEILEGDNISFENLLPGVYTVKLVTTTITENYKIVKLK